MALVTGRSPQCSSNSEAEADDEESNKNKSEWQQQSHPERRLSTDSVRSTNSIQSNSSDIQQHLQSMLDLLKNDETLKMAVKLESNRSNRTRYLVITSRCCYRSPTDRKGKLARNNSTKSSVSVDRNSNKLQQQQQQSLPSDNDNVENVFVESAQERSTAANRQSSKCDADKSGSGDNKGEECIEESCLLGIDCNERTTIGLVVPILADTTIHLDGDGGFSVSVNDKTHIFKPVSVQAMWSALQTLHKVSQKAYKNNFYSGGPSHDWLSFYEQHIQSDQSCLNEWNAMDSIESKRPPSPDAIRNKPTAKEETESVIRMKLKEIMMAVDLDEVTSKYIRGRLEEQLNMDLAEYKSFIDSEMLMILGQMDAPTEIFEHVYLGSEWNAFNLEELQKNGVRHILNVTREIDNFFPGTFNYYNVRVYDDEKTNLLKHWDNTYRYIRNAKESGSKVLVHCKMGVSRSASVVIAYAMKAYNWELQQALQHVKERRSCIKPNKNFLNQLETYRGMLVAMMNKDKLQRSKSETNLKSTKDARLLPGSEPTPLIQALNHTAKTAGDSQAGGGSDGPAATAIRFGRTGRHLRMASASSSADHKQRRTMRRSSSTSPQSIQNTTAIVMKQQSQSLENLTPERSVAEEQRNVRYPGSNGENYSVSQNQVLHIQKNTPPTSVRTRVHEMEATRHGKKTADDRKLLNLPFGRSADSDKGSAAEDSGEAAAPASTGGKQLGSPVWTSSAKLITQSSNLEKAHPLQPHHPLRSSLRSRRHTTTEEGPELDRGAAVFKHSASLNADDKRRNRKTQSWAATTGFRLGHIMDAPVAIGDGAASAMPPKLGSNSSIESSSSVAGVGDSCVRTRPPLRHASWGSADTRYSVPMRNSSWGPYDSNRNSTTHYHRNSAAASAIFEGQIHDTNTSNKTAASCRYHQHSPHHHQHHHHHHHRDEAIAAQHEIGKVKLTKQKLEASTAAKKPSPEGGCPKKRQPSLYRSASAATGAARTRFQQRCNSEELVPSDVAAVMQPAPHTVHREDCRHTIPPYSASAPDTYTISDIENKNMLSQQDLDDDSAAVLLRGAHPDAAEHQRISGNVQILKKNFEAKAGGQSATASCNCVQAGGAPATTSSATATKKGHHSLPSSPVAQHVDHSGGGAAATVASMSSSVAGHKTSGDGACFEPSAAKNPNTTASASYSASSSSSSSASSSSGSVSEQNERIVKNMIHRYQTTKVAAAGKPHNYSENRPPPAPMRTSQSPTLLAASLAATTATSMTTTTTQTASSLNPQERQQTQLQQHRRLQPLSKGSHSRLFSQQNLNTAAYNTM